MIRAYQECCAEVVERWDGHVAKYMGDGVLAYFGWPQAHEDDAERAVRAGLELSRGGRLELQASGRQPLAARVGIATGLVMVGELIGEGAAQEAGGGRRDAEPGGAPAGARRAGRGGHRQATRRLVGGLFELTDLGPLRLKGFAEPLAALRVEGEGRAEGRFEALHGAAAHAAGRARARAGDPAGALGLGQGRRRPGGAARRASRASASRACSGRCARS